MNRRIYLPFYSPEDALGGGGGSKEKFDDDTALLDTLLDSKPPKESESEDEHPDEESEIISDLIGDDEEEEEKEDKEDKEDEPSEEELDLGLNARSVDFSKIKEKFGDFSKTSEFRELKNAYFREGKYTELFPTLEDAQEAAENNETFQKINDQLINKADIAGLLNSVKETSPESFKKIATTFLDKLAATDANTYQAAVIPVLRRLAKSINSEGSKKLKYNDEDREGRALVATARNILLYLDMDPDEVDKAEPPTNTEPSEKEKELTKREQEIQQRDFYNAASNVVRVVDKRLDKAILEGLDPDNRLSEFVRDSLLEKIKNDVKGQTDRDKIHVKRMESLWKRARATQYSQESLSRIVSAYLERVRPIIPATRSKYRGMALKGTSRKESDNDENVRIPKAGRTGRTPPNEGKVNLKAVDPRKVDYSKTSDEDILSGKATLRR